VGFRRRLGRSAHGGLKRRQRAILLGAAGDDLERIVGQRPLQLQRDRRRRREPGLDLRASNTSLIASSVDRRGSLPFSMWTKEALHNKKTRAAVLGCAAIEFELWAPDVDVCIPSNKDWNETGPNILPAIRAAFAIMFRSKAQLVDGLPVLRLQECSKIANSSRNWRLGNR
jgi:hypothetical protein